MKKFLPVAGLAVLAVVAHGLLIGSFIFMSLSPSYNTGPAQFWGPVWLPGLAYLAGLALTPYFWYLIIRKNNQAKNGKRPIKKVKTSVIN